MLALLLQLTLTQQPTTVEANPLTSTVTPTTVPTRPLSTMGGPLPSHSLSDMTSLPVSGADALIRKVALVEGRGAPCEMMATSALCDDPSVIAVSIADGPPPSASDAGEGGVSHLEFTALKVGRTTCNCGLPKGFKLVYDFSVTSLEDAMLPVARKVVVVAFSRLYTQPRLVP